MFNFDLFKSKKITKKQKGRFYTPSYVISTVFPPLAWASNIWPECAKEVFKEMGFRSGFRDQMMPHFSRIHAKCLQHSDAKEEKKKARSSEIITRRFIKRNPPPQIKNLDAWKEVLDKHIGIEVKQKDYYEALPTLLIHYRAHELKYYSDIKDKAHKKVKAKGYTAYKGRKAKLILDSMVEYFNSKKLNLYNLDSVERRKRFNQFYSEKKFEKLAETSIKRDIEALAISHYKTRSMKKSIFTFKSFHS